GVWRGWGWGVSVAGGGTSSWWRCSTRPRCPSAALSPNPGQRCRCRSSRHHPCRCGRCPRPREASGSRSDRDMHAGKNMGIMTSQKKPTPERKGRPPPRPWQSVVAWSQALEEAAWRRIDVRDGSQGPLVVEAVKRRVVSRTHRRQQGDEELLTVIRYRDRDRDEGVKVGYYLSHTVPESWLAEL